MWHLNRRVRWAEKSDGRGIRLQPNVIFKGFIDYYI